MEKKLQKQRYYKKSLKPLLSLIVFSIVLLAISCDSQKKLPPQINEKEIKKIIIRSGKYLVKQAKPNGKFVYRINLRPIVKLKPSYNVLRHAGTIYSLAMFYEQEPDENTLTAITRTGQYLRDIGIKPVDINKRISAIWSSPDFDSAITSTQAKLGGTGLGLVALMSIEKISPGFTPLSTLQSLGRFIVFMQKPDGSFYSKYTPSENWRQDPWASLYYPGEAALGLVMLYQKDNNELWFKAAVKAMEYLALSRKNVDDIPPDHWALLATEQIFKSNSVKTISVPEKLLKEHAIQICNSFLKDQVVDPSKERLYGSFSIDERVTPNSTRLEGLIAAHSFLLEDEIFREKIFSAINKGILFVSEAQIKEGDFEGAIPRVKGNAKGEKRLKNLKNPRSTEVRIDYVQHALSAFIGYYKIIKNHSETK